MLLKDTSSLHALAGRTLDRCLQSLPNGVRCSLDVADRRHLINLGSLGVCLPSLEFLLAEWFDHLLEALRSIRFLFKMLKVCLKSAEFVKSQRPIINI